MPEFTSTIENIVLFKDLSETEMQQVAERVTIRTCPLGEYLFIAGTPRSELFIIQSGEVEILQGIGDVEKTIARLGEGNFVGEGAILDEEAHSNSCRAVVETRLLVLPRKALEDLLESSPEAARKILSQVARVMAYRLKYASFGYREAVVAASVSGKVRLEHDLLGEREVPTDVYYGVQTLRALENYDITGIRLSHFPNLVKALAMVKKAAAKANQKLGDLNPTNCFQSHTMLTQAIKTLTQRCIKGITANRRRCREFVENSIGIVTALNPFIGYENSTRIAKRALETSRSVMELVLEEGLLSQDQLEDILSPQKMTRPRV